MISLEGMSTETRNPNTMNLDEMSILEILEVMNEEDKNVLKAINKAIPQIEKAVKSVVNSFQKGGKLVYIGAGTSGRLGILDAAECVPTFGSDPEMVQGIIAGGDEAMVKAVEGAEDDLTLAIDDLKKINLTENDTLVGIAASGRTPYVIGGLDYANSIGASTVSISCNHDSQIGKKALIAIEAVPGPEVLTGSTRLKSGTVQKLILNMISTTAMVKIGKVYQNLMVDVLATNQKLEKRAENIVKEATGVDSQVARASLEKSKGEVKTAIVMLLTDVSYQEAKQLLKRTKGHIREAIKKME